MFSGFCNRRRNNHPKPFKPAGVVVYLSLSCAALWAQEASFHTTATYVLIDASVTTSKGVPVAGLTPENFEIRENGQSQEILRFDSGSASVAMVVAADFSGSMKPRQIGVASGVGTLAGLLQPDDEARLLLFNEYILPVELDPTEWRTELLARVPTGQTAIYDAVNRGLEQLGESTHQRRVLIVLSDGSDTASKTKREELFETLRATGALVYCVGLFKPGEAD
jgi:Ca-activated chloride channel family protein